MKINSPDEFWAEQRINLFVSTVVGLIGILGWVNNTLEEARIRKKMSGPKSKKR